jgi:hypothetical protein
MPKQSIEKSNYFRTALAQRFTLNVAYSMKNRLPARGVHTPWLDRYLAKEAKLQRLAKPKECTVGFSACSNAACATALQIRKTLYRYAAWFCVEVRCEPRIVFPRLGASAIRRHNSFGA